MLSELLTEAAAKTSECGGYKMMGVVARLDWLITKFYEHGKRKMRVVFYQLWVQDLVYCRACALILFCSQPLFAWTFDSMDYSFGCNKARFLVCLLVID